MNIRKKGNNNAYFNPPEDDITNFTQYLPVERNKSNYNKKEIIKL